MTRPHAVLLCLGAWLALGAASAMCGAAPTSPDSSTNAPTADKGPRAQLRVSGYGLLGNLELKRTLRSLLADPKSKPAAFDANFIEDSALLLLNTVLRQGYLQPHLEAAITLTNDTVLTFTWDKEFTTLLPRPLAARRVAFRVRPGVLYYYRQLTFSGLESLRESKARSFFLETDTLLPLKTGRRYTPSGLEKSAAQLAAALADDGYQEATVTATNLVVDDRSGAVRVHILVRQGQPHWIRSFRSEIYPPGATAPAKTVTIHPAVPYSRVWLQDRLQALRTNEFRRGYADATVTLTPADTTATATNVLVDLNARVDSGPQYTLGQVRFQGNQRTRLATLQRRVHLEPGEPLDTVAVDEGRFRLARLGIFNSVGVRYEDAGAQTRDVLYELAESERTQFSLILGYGSYDLLGGGFEFERKNLFGLAHQTRLRATQTFKSSQLNYLYTIPEAFHPDLNLFLDANGLRREEISFDRLEYGASVGAQRFLPQIASDASLRYSYQFLNADESGSGNFVRQDRSEVSSFILDLRHDRRDSPLNPRKGYNVFSNLELAFSALGGQVDYQRLDLGASLHRRVGPGRFLHFGLSHGFISTLGGSAAEIPINRRFFPGGENSVRGFQLGEAAPRDPDGNIIGAETYLQGNLELEQFISPSWSVVGFVDGVTFAEHLGDYPGDETLFSAGGGLRFKTIIGPARLEYGRNLNPRPGDPRGTLHFSIGFPF